MSVLPNFYVFFIPVVHALHLNAQTFAQWPLKNFNLAAFSTSSSAYSPLTGVGYISRKSLIQIDSKQAAKIYAWVSKVPFSVKKKPVFNRA
jgi:hypothetical protein